VPYLFRGKAVTSAEMVQQLENLPVFPWDDLSTTPVDTVAVVLGMGIHPALYFHPVYLKVNYFCVLPPL
jgi:hypothetical protein